MTAAVGIDLGGTKMAAGVVDASGTLVSKVSVPRPRSSEEMAVAPLRLAREVLTDEVKTVGLGVAGLVRWPVGELVWGPNIVGEGIRFRELLEDGLGLPAAVDNDANVAALAEVRIGAAQGFDNVVMLTLGTGIGGGLVIGGEVFRGASFAGEIGHVIVDVGGPFCTCGQRGCWETFASGRRLDQMARDLVAVEPDGPTARKAGMASANGIHLTSAALEGDTSAARMIGEMGTWLGLGIANLVAILDPDVFVIGGGVSRAGNILLEPARQAVEATLEGSKYRSRTRVVGSALGEDSALVGAGLLALEELRG